MQTYSTPVLEHSGLRYRIEMRNNQGIWQQRHVWYPSPATFLKDGELHKEAWIRSVTGLTADMRPVP